MVSDVRDFYRQSRTCCMVLPLFQGGLMTILYFNFFLAVFCSVMAFFGPKILALVQPTTLSYVFGLLYAAVALLHIYGIVCVERNMIQEFRRFKSFTLYTIGFIFALALVFILATSAQHSSSISQCMNVYRLRVNASFKKKVVENRATTTDSAVNAAMTVCDLFTWVQVAVMVVVWFTLAGVQIYFALKHKVYYQLKHEDFLEDNARL